MAIIDQAIEGAVGAAAQKYLVAPNQLFALGNRLTGNGPVWGSPIPLTQGKRAVPGVPIWFGPVQKQTFSYTSGTAEASGVLGPNGSMSSYTRLSRDFAVAFGHNLGLDGEHADPQIRRIWVDNVLAYDATGGLSAPVDMAYATNAQRLQMAYAKMLTALSFTLYPGSQTQKPDPLMLADKGSLCSAYHGLIYIVFHDLTVGHNISTHVDLASTVVPLANLESGANSFLSAQQDWQTGVNEAHLFGTDGTGNSFPAVTVEFVDGTLTQVTATTIASPTFSSGSTINLNWITRILKTFNSGGLGMRTVDLNAEFELPAVTVSGNVDGAPIALLPGTVGGPALWEPTGNYIYTVANSGNSAPIVAFNADTGVVSSQATSGSVDLTPSDATHGDCYALKTPCTFFPIPTQGCICYALDGSTAAVPVICMGRFDVVAMPIVTAGVLPSPLPYGSFVRLNTAGSGLSVNGMVPVPLAQLSIAKNAAPYQDIAFVYMYGNVFELEFFSAHNGVAQFIQSANLLTVAPGRLAMSALFDPSDGSVVLFHCAAGNTDWQITRLPITFGNVTVPGFRGLSPSFGAPVYQNVSVPLLDAAALDDVMNNSDLSQSTFGYTSSGGAVTIDLKTGIATTLVFGGGFSAPSYAWDSKSNTVYGVSGGNVQKLPIAQSVTNSAALPLNVYLRWLALEAGYTQAQISVDPRLTDPIDGAMLLQATDTAGLFESLGQLYDFTAFESEGKIKFVPASHNPLKATGTLTLSGVAEGDQITLGSVRYRFTANPSVINDIRIGSTPLLSAQILIAAINATGVSGQDYFPGTKQNPDAEASLVAGQLLATARSGGTIGNLIPTTVQVGVASWSHPTLTGGDVPPVPGVNLTPADMAPLSENTVASDNEVIVTTLNQPNSVPSAIAINYWDEGQDYQRSTQTFQPDNSIAAGAATNITALDSIFVTTSAEAYRRVSKLAIRATQAAVTQEFRLPWKFLYLEPSDVVSITLAPFSYVVRLDECTINGDFSVSCSGMNYAFRDDIPVTDQPLQGLIVQPPPSDGSGLPVVLDVPLFDASKGTTPSRLQVEVGVRAAQLLVPFGSANVSFGLATQGNLVNYATFDTDLKYGTAFSALPDTTLPFQTDNVNTLTLVGKTAIAALFQGGTQLDALNGKNCILLGAPGRWEYIYFRDVTVVNPNVVTIGGLMRGRRGTEINTGSHVAGETFYLLKSLSPLFGNPLREQILPSTNIGAAFLYNAASTSDAGKSQRVTVTFTGLSLYPFAPCRLQAKLNQPTNNDLLLSWLRRDRAGTHWVTLPTEMSETSERYDLDIYNGSTIVRTLTNLTTPAYTYSVADQTTDGFVAPQTTLKFAVTQKGELGRGFQRLETVNVG